MFTVITMSEKGGVGKTTLTATLGAGLAILGLRVLQIDTDTQGHLATLWGFEKKPDELPGLARLLLKTAKSYGEVITPIPPAQWLPVGWNSGGGLALVQSNGLVRNIPDQFEGFGYFKDALKPLDSYFDVCLIDTSPSLSKLLTAALIAADAVLIPTVCEALAMDSLNDTIDHITAANVARQKVGLPALVPGGIIPNKHYSITNDHRMNLELIQAAHPDKTYEPIIQRTSWSGAVNKHKPVMVAAPRSNATKEAWGMIRRFYTDFFTPAPEALALLDSVAPLEAVYE